MQIDRNDIKNALISAGVGSGIALIPFLYENLGKCFVIDRYVNQGRKLITLKLCPDKRLNSGFFPIMIPVEAAVIVTIASIAAATFALKKVFERRD
jgi:hypothetical protein